MRLVKAIFLVFVAMSGWTLFLMNSWPWRESAPPRKQGAEPTGEIREMPPLLEIEAAMRSAVRGAASEDVLSGEQAARARIEEFFSTWLGVAAPREFHVRGWRVWSESGSSIPEPNANIVATLFTAVGPNKVIWTLRAERERRR